MRIVSVDFGLKRLGLAITDENQIIALPLPNVEASKQTEETIKNLLKALEPYEIEKMVIGNPLHLSGRASFLTDEVEHFAEALRKHVDFPIILWDERLSTAEATKTLAPLSRKKRAKLVDSVAAVLILQSFLNTFCSDHATL